MTPAGSDEDRAEPSTWRDTLGFTSRLELLQLWDQLGKDKQTLALDLLRQMVAAEGDGPLVRTGKK